jgi:uncharacterized protein with von Willebrand factor type A (vWA) domain
VTGTSRIGDNLLLFCRTLRQAGLPIGPGQVIEASQAILQTGIERRDDFYVALRAVLVKDPGQVRLFDQAFHVYFRNPRLLERMMGLLLPTLVTEPEAANNEATVRRLLETLTGESESGEDEVVIEVDRSGSYSRDEVLRDKDFEQMSLEEQAAAKAMLRESLDAAHRIPTRRFRPDSHGRRYDLRRSMQLMLRTNGQLVEIARKSRRHRPPALVLLSDISGSMSGYSRMFLHFAHALGLQQRRVYSFVFGTRLTNVTRWLMDRDADRALERVAGEVQDWDGGTRIADCLEGFNVDWGRRVLSGRAIVVLLSDGLERDSATNLEFQMQRLQRTAEQLVWLNPLLRFDEFEPRASGIRAMMPYVDRFLPAHNVNSLIDLGRLLSDGWSSTRGIAARDRSGIARTGLSGATG